MRVERVRWPQVGMVSPALYEALLTLVPVEQVSLVDQGGRMND